MHCVARQNKLETPKEKDEFNKRELVRFVYYESLLFSDTFTLTSNKDFLKKLNFAPVAWHPFALVEGQKSKNTVRQTKKATFSAFSRVPSDTSHCLDHTPGPPQRSLLVGSYSRLWCCKRNNRQCRQLCFVKKKRRRRSRTVSSATVSRSGRMRWDFLANCTHRLFNTQTA